MRSLRILTAALLMLGLHAAAQQPAAKSDLSVEAKLVLVPAVVRDKHNALVATLKKEDFALTVDGKSQSIRYFDHESDVPLTVGLLVDTSMSQRNALDAERTASSAFLDKMLAPNRDKAFLVQFARQVELLQDVTDSRPKLQQALKQIDTASPSFQPSTNGDDRSSRDHFGTAFYDSIFLASDEITAKQKGRRALILLTDGVDRNSKESLTTAIESAQRADTIIYAIYYKGESPHDHDRDGGGYPGGGHRGGGYPGGGGGWPGGGGQRGGGQGGGGNSGGGGRGGYGHDVDGKKILERICGETGGRVFEVSKKQTVDVIYNQIAEELRAQYRLGFTPTTEAAAEGYHQINLTLVGAEAKNKETVQTRDGYYTGAKK